MPTFNNKSVQGIIDIIHAELTCFGTISDKSIKAIINAADAQGITITDHSVQGIIDELGSFSCEVPYPGQPDVFYIPGSYSWIVPQGVTSVKVLVIGAGGGGGGGSYAGSGGGGGGVAIHNSISVTPGTSIDIYVGAGGVGAITSPLTQATAGEDTTTGFGLIGRGGKGGFSRSMGSPTSARTPGGTFFTPSDGFGYNGGTGGEGGGAGDELGGDGGTGGGGGGGSEYSENTAKGGIGWYGGGGGGGHTMASSEGGTSLYGGAGGQGGIGASSQGLPGLAGIWGSNAGNVNISGNVAACGGGGGGSYGGGGGAGSGWNGANGAGGLVAIRYGTGAPNWPPH